jgi:hydroxyacylglutathione hydrolase
MSQPVTIARIPILPFGMVNSHVLIAGTDCILVDAGLPGSEHKIGRVLRRHGRGFADIKLIIITHAHVDHAGSAARLRALSGAPIAAHAGDLPYYQQRAAMSFCETGWFGRLFMRTGLILQPYQPFTPDILLDGETKLDLAPYGIDGTVHGTPGHTAGSLSVTLAQGDALVGDLIASGILLGGLVRTGQAKRPPFEDDPALVARQLRHMLDSGSHCFHMGHGGPLPAPEVRRHAAGLAHARRGHCCHGPARPG